MRITKSTQDKLQQLLEALEYQVRYEKGSFKAGYCVVHTQKTVLINKFVPLEGIIQTLTEIIRQLAIPNVEHLSEEQQKLWHKIHTEKEDDNLDSKNT